MLPDWVQVNCEVPAAKTATQPVAVTVQVAPTAASGQSRVVLAAQVGAGDGGGGSLICYEPVWCIVFIRSKKVDQ